MYSKLLIEGKIEVLTGLHIGASDAYAAIGAANSPVIRDPKTQLPIIPGSSLKGKIRTLLVKDYVNECVLYTVDEEPDSLKRLFGSAASTDHDAIPSRLQFMDCFLANLKEDEISPTEVKTENYINRLTSVANPRSLERVIRGAEFNFAVVYNVEKIGELVDDMKTLSNGIKLLQLDYLGGHGSRGSGRIRFKDLKAFYVAGSDDENLLNDVKTILEEIENAKKLPL